MSRDGLQHVFTSLVEQWDKCKRSYSLTIFARDVTLKSSRFWLKLCLISSTGITELVHLIIYGTLYIEQDSHILIYFYRGNFRNYNRNNIASTVRVYSAVSC